MRFFQIRVSKYPLNRAVKLIEAISKDLSTQLLKVLNTQRLMLVSLEDFEKTSKLCATVFQTWDDEYEELQNLLHKMSKRNREERLNMIMVWRFKPSHKRLQTRLSVMQE